MFKTQKDLVCTRKMVGSIGPSRWKASTTGDMNNQSHNATTVENRTEPTDHSGHNKYIPIV